MPPRSNGSLRSWPTSTPPAASSKPRSAPRRCSPTPSRRRLYARDASMVEGGCALVALPDDARAGAGVRRERPPPHGPPDRAPGKRHGPRRRRHADRRRPRGHDRAHDRHPRGPTRGPPRLGRAGRAQPRSREPSAGRWGGRYAPDPSSQQTSSIGGNVNTNAGGPHCLAYGVTSAHVLALDVVLADGSIERLGAEGPEAAGYDLRGVVVGSEGTLGLVTRRVRAHPAGAARRADDAVRLRHGRGVRRHRLGDHRPRSRAGGGRDDGPRHRARGRDVRPRRLSDRRGRRAAGRGRRHRGGRGGADARGGGVGRRERGVERAGRERRGRAGAAVEGSQVRVRRDRADRPPLPPARLRGAAHEARRGADAASTRSPSATA